MSVLVKGMEMPTSCNECPLHKLWPWDDEVQCLVNRELWNDNSGRHKLCPLVPVPDHGRLIDLDDLMPRIQEEIYQSKLVFRRADCEWENGVWFGKNKIGDMVLNSPVVIPAEKGEESCT